jgi:hypothetical protein
VHHLTWLYVSDSNHELKDLLQVKEYGFLGQRTQPKNAKE